MIDLFNVAPEKFYALRENELFKEQKINQCLDSNNYVASVKKDGNYARFVNLNGESKIQTRGISVKTKTYGEVQEKVPHIFNFLKENLPNNTLLVGELYFHGGSDHDVGSILRCLPPKAIKRQKDNPLIFYIFDVWYYGNENFMIKTREERNEKLKEIENKFKSVGAPAYFEFAKYTDKCRALMEKAFDNNEEGIVLTLKDSIVNPGTRTAWKTLKIKKELQNDADVFLTGNYKFPEKEYVGKEIETWEYWMNEKTGEMLGGQHYQDYINGATIIPVKKTFYMGWPSSVEMGVIDEDTGKIVSVGWLSGLTDEIKEDFINNIPKYTNKPLKINAMETTEDFKFRHSKFICFRDDIGMEDCTFQKIFKKEGEE
jgi:hypothetical protein